MVKMTPVDYDPFAQAPATPMGQSNLMPPGTTPGRMTVQSPLDTSMVPLSDEAERANSLLLWGTMTGNKGVISGAQDILKNDPTQQARSKQSTEMGADAARRAEARRTGVNILNSFAELQHTFDNANDDALKGAIGPYNNKPFMSHLPLVGGMTVPEAKAAYSPFSDGKSWNLRNELKHLTHGLTNAIVSGAGKGLNMSNDRQELFQKTMEDFIGQTNRDEAAKILRHAKVIIQNDFGLNPEEADTVIRQRMEYIKHEKEKADRDIAGQRGAPPVAGASPSPAQGQPPQSAEAPVSGPPQRALLELVANAEDKNYIESFNRHFNGGNPGLAERVIAHAAGVPVGPVQPMPRGSDRNPHESMWDANPGEHYMHDGTLFRRAPSGWNIFASDERVGGRDDQPRERKFSDEKEYWDKVAPPINQ